MPAPRRCCPPYSSGRSPNSGGACRAFGKAPSTVPASPPHQRGERRPPDGFRFVNGRRLPSSLSPFRLDSPMLIVCPNCATSYRVEPSSLGAAGRSVRCVRCRTIWFAREPGALAAVTRDFRVDAGPAGGRGRGRRPRRAIRPVSRRGRGVRAVLARGRGDRARAPARAGARRRWTRPPSRRLPRRPPMVRPRPRQPREPVAIDHLPGAERA